MQEGRGLKLNTKIIEARLKKPQYYIYQNLKRKRHTQNAITQLPPPQVMEKEMTDKWYELSTDYVAHLKVLRHGYLSMLGNNRIATTLKCHCFFILTLFRVSYCLKKEFALSLSSTLLSSDFSITSQPKSVYMKASVDVWLTEDLAFNTFL